MAIAPRLASWHHPARSSPWADRRIGGVLGAILGAAIAAAYATSQGWLVAMPVAGLVVGVAAAGAVGGLAGIYPALRAANTPPTDALRS